MTRLKATCTRIAHAAWNHWAVALGIAIYAIVTVSYLDYVPTWDGYLYTDELMQNLHKPMVPFGVWLSGFAIGKGHAAYAYALTLAVAYFVLGQCPAAFIAGNIFLGVLGVLSYYVMLRSTLARQTRTECGLMTMLLACSPLYLACTVHLNLDFPIIVFFLVFLAGLCRGQCVIPAIAAVCLLFSKETGAVFHAFFAVSFLLLFAGKRVLDCLRRSTKGRAGSLSASFAPISLAGLFALFLPLVVYAAYVVIGGQIYGYGVEKTGGPLANLGFVSSLVSTRLMNVFVLNFSWVFTGVVILALVRWLWLEKPYGLTVWQNDILKTLCYLFVFYLLLNALITVYHVGAKPRYVLPLVVLLSFFFCHAATYLFSNPYARRAVILGCSGLLLAQSLVCVDVVSKRCYGTIPFGSHDVLRINSRLGGRYGVCDEFVYNLQHTVVDKLLGMAFALCKLTPEDTVVVPLDWYTVNRIDRRTMRRTARLDNCFTPAVYAPYRILREPLPSNAFYITMPWDRPNSRELEWVGHFYTIVTQQTVSVQGYALSVCKVSIKKPAGPLPKK